MKCCDKQTVDECPIHSSELCEYCVRMKVPHKIRDCEYHREVRVKKEEDRLYEESSIELNNHRV